MKSNSDSEFSISSEVSIDCISDADSSTSSSNMPSKKQILSFVNNMQPADQNQAKELSARAIFASGALLSIVENTY